MSDEPVQLRPHAFTPLADAEGQPRSRFAPYLPVLNACSLCPARCCRLHVKVSLPDAVHYCRTLGVPFFAGLTIVPSKDPEHAFTLDADPRFAESLAPWTGKAEIELLRREDGGCRSLVKVGEHERCGVYGARPTFCRTYPAGWRAETVEGGPASILCPVPYGIDPQHEAELKAEVQRSIRFWRLHDEIVAEWNGMSCDRGVQDFLRFAIERVCEAMSWSADLTLAEGTRDQRLYDAMLKAKVVAQPKFRMTTEPERPFADLPIKPC